MEDNIHKIWGERRRILLTDQTEIDLLYLKKGSFCSKHTHENKINKFILISGKVVIRTEYGTTELSPTEHLSVEPPLKHRFEVMEDSVMIEIAFVNDGKIDPKDIDREKQGGRWVEGKEMTLDEMREEGMLDLSEEIQ